MSADAQDADEFSEDRPALDRSTAGTTAGGVRRIGSAVLGGALLLRGLRRRSVGGAATALFGGWLLYRSVGGRERRSRAGDEGHPEHGTDGTAVEIERSVVVGKPAEDLAEYWRDPETLSEIVGRFADVTAAGENRQRWTADGPLGRSVSWETRIADDEPGEFLRWESVDTRIVSGEGSVHFRPAPGDRGTEVTLRVRFEPPGGTVTSAALESLGVVSGSLVRTALDRFKSLAETGEIPTLERNPSARGEGDLV